jgi:tRNA pseudouridine32 synthase/23S rRNA pseudouridine746 synthase
MTPEEMQDRVLYRDGLILVINKPAGLPVHAGPKGGDTLDRHFDALRFGLPRAPELAHRLDRETSGCLVLGRHRKALAKLGKLFSSGRIDKTYIAVTRGRPPEASGLIDLPLAKRSEVRGWWMKVDREKGMPSATQYRLIGEKDGMCLLELKPLTGRTHQIRVHLAEIGCPIVGERIYDTSPPPPAGPMLHLHAAAIRIPMRDGHEPVDVSVAPPPHIAATMEALGLSYPKTSSS